MFTISTVEFRNEEENNPECVREWSRLSAAITSLLRGSGEDGKTTAQPRHSGPVASQGGAQLSGRQVIDGFLVGI